MILGAGSLWHAVTNKSVGVGWSRSETKARGAKPELLHAPVQLLSLHG